MTKKTYYIPVLTLILGLLFWATYFFSDFLFEKLWIIYLLPLIGFGLGFFIFFVLTIVQKDKKGILIGVFIIGAVALTEFLGSEVFKSKKILEATLMDDRSAIRLTLREDNKFEIVSETIASTQIFKGQYMLVNNKIIFKDRPYDNNFIPDTLTIIGNKIIRHFDKSGRPITQFATYFDINKNEIKQPANDNNNGRIKNAL
ncbi:MAG: hypothetical protein EOO91_12545 [Pedobacter sp.]|nr:MAG: hypothetical protein EOO91_12545 [Pedobacter sp.]